MGAGPYQKKILFACAFFSWYYVGDSVRNLFNLSLSPKVGSPTSYTPMTVRGRLNQNFSGSATKREGARDRKEKRSVEGTYCNWDLNDFVEREAIERESKVENLKKSMLSTEDANSKTPSKWVTCQITQVEGKATMGGVELGHM